MVVNDESADIPDDHRGHESMSSVYVKGAPWPEQLVCKRVSLASLWSSCTNSQQDRSCKLPLSL